MNIELPKLFSWQEKVFLNLLKNWDNSTHVIKSRRQCGKSILCEVILIYAALSKPNQKCYLLSPTFPQADKVLNEINDMIPKDKGLRKSINNVKRNIKFTNGSEIRIFSAEQGDNLRGYTSNLLICDESAYISDKILDLVFPYVNVSRGPILLFSTPRATAGNFYTYYKMGMEHQPNIFSYDWSIEDVSALLPPEKLELYKKTMDPLAYKTDYLGQFLTGESKFFSDFSGCIKPKQEWKGQPVIFGIDWNGGDTGGDYTAISVLGLDKTLYDIIYFNDKDPKQTIEIVKKLAFKYKPNRITVELNSIGNVYFAFLRDSIKEYKIPVIGFTTTNSSKDKIISKLQLAFQNNDISFYNDVELMVELQQFEMEFSKTGKRVFNAADTFHDDLVMSLAIAYNSITSGNYAVY